MFNRHRRFDNLDAEIERLGVGEPLAETMPDRWSPDWGICIACENEVAPIFEDDLCDGCLEMRDENIRIQRLESAERKRTRFERAVTRIEARKQELREMREAKRAKEQERAAGWADMEEDANPLEREKAELRCALDMVARAMCLGCLSRPREVRRMLCPRCLMIGKPPRRARNVAVRATPKAVPTPVRLEGQARVQELVRIAWPLIVGDKPGERVAEAGCWSFL